MSLNTKQRSFKVKFSLLVLVYGSFCTFSSYCIADPTTFNGPTELYSQTFKDLLINGPSKLDGINADSLTINGPLNFTALKIKGKTEISGTFSGEDAELSDVVIHGPFEGSKIIAKNLQVDGDVTLEDFKIDGNVNINGPLKAKNGSFKDINSVYAPIAFYSVTLNNINVKKTNHQDGGDNTNSDDNTNNYEIKLAGNTVINGNITFESGKGVVFIRDKTAQLKGKVIGGTVKNNNL